MTDAALIDGHPVYEWQEYHNENGGTQLVSEVPEGVTDVTTYSGQSLRVKPGDLIAQTTRPGEYTRVTDLDGWSLEGVNPFVPPEDDAVPEQYDPENHTVADVKRYLDEQREAGNEDEFNRVVSAEQDARNRTGVVTQTF